MSSKGLKPDKSPDEPKAKREKLDVLTKRDLNEGKSKLAIDTNTSTNLGTKVKSSLILLIRFSQTNCSVDFETH